jgi:hypothetical protein
MIYLKPRAIQNHIRCDKSRRSRTIYLLWTNKNLANQSHIDAAAEENPGNQRHMHAAIADRVDTKGAFSNSRNTKVIRKYKLIS